MGLRELLDGEYPNRIANPVDGFYIYAFDEYTLHKMEVRNGKVLWSEPYELEDERRRKIEQTLSTDFVEFGEESDGENEIAGIDFKSRNQGIGCSEIIHWNQEFDTNN